MRTLALLALLAWPARCAAPALLDALRLDAAQMRLVAGAVREAGAARAEERADLAVQERRALEVGRVMLRRAGAGQELAPAWLQARWHEADRAREAAKARTRATLRALAERVGSGLRPAQLAALKESTRDFTPERGEPDARARVERFLLQPETLPALKSRAGGKI